MQLDFTGKKALVRVDFNVPLNAEHQVTDDNRIRAALPTIRHILDGGGAAILMSHLGRPQKKRKEDGSLDREKFSLRYVVEPLSERLGMPVQFAASTVGEEAQEKARALKPGEVLLLENTRFQAGEEKGDPDFARQLAELGDVYVNDAFGSAHRAHASTTVVAQYFEPGQRDFGFLMKSELENAQKLLQDPSRPFIAIIGGAKVSDKIQLLDSLLQQVDHLVIGGGMAYTFLKAQGGEVGQSLVEEDKLDLARQLLEQARQKGVSVHLPEDSIIADAFSNEAEHRQADSKSIPEGWMGLDIGEQARKAFREAILQGRRILWNGPMGVFEMPNYAEGTKAVAQAVADATEKGAFSLVGGGDSVAAVGQMGLADAISYVSTGGGAMLELLEGKTLPGVAALEG